MNWLFFLLRLQLHTELLHPPERVSILSCLDDLPIGDSAQPESAHLELVARRLKALVFPRMGPPANVPEDNPVPVRDHIRYIPVDVREAVPEQLNESGFFLPG